MTRQSLRTSAGPSKSPTTAPDPRRWSALAAVSAAQLMIGLDLTIMNIALPSAQRALHVANADRQWVVTAFALAYGGLLLLGGSVSDLIGRKRALLVGLTGFAIASAAGGAAQNPGTLFGARAVQGVFGALMTPSVLAVLATTFQLPEERGRAFGIYGTVMGSSSGIGVLLGGVLTQYVDWRWCMFVNLPIAAAAGAGVIYAVRRVPPGRDRQVDVLGGALATAGLMALVYGFSRAATDGWGASITLSCLITGAAVLALFLVQQAVAAAPLLPMRILRDVRRAACYTAVFTLAVGMFGALFFLTFYLQTVKEYSAVKTGFAFLPLTVGLMAGVRAAAPLLHRLSAVALLPAGLLTLAGALTLLALTHTGSGYWTHVMPVFLLVGVGTGWVLVTANSTATLDAGPDTSVAGAMVMTSQQIGASLGTALLSTVAASSAAHYARTHRGATAGASVHGLNTASTVAAVILVIGAGLVWTLLAFGRRRSAGA